MSSSSSSLDHSTNRSSPRKSHSIEDRDAELKEIEKFRFSDDEGEDSDASTLDQGLEFPSGMPENYFGPLRRRYQISDDSILDRERAVLFEFASGSAKLFTSILK